MAQAGRLGLVACAALLVGCGGSSAPKPPHGGPVLRLALPLVPTTLDPARVADLPSLNVAHELYAGLTRFSGAGVEPDLAESWEPSENGLVWTFHLRKRLRWSDDAPITAEDFRRSWLRALSPALHSAYARAEMQNIRGARRYRVTGSGEVGVEAVDDRTLRVTLQHPVPWLDEQVAWPVFFPVPKTGNATSGPFRLASRTKSRLVLERNVSYWNVSAVKPRRIVLTGRYEGSDAILPAAVAAPGFPWIQTDPHIPAGSQVHQLPTLSIKLLWFATRHPALADPAIRKLVAAALDRTALAREAGQRPVTTIVPPAMPGAKHLEVAPRRFTPEAKRLDLTLAAAGGDLDALTVAETLKGQLAKRGIRVTVKLVSFRRLLALVGPPLAPDVDLVLLGWSAEFFDVYNILDLFPCASAFNVAQWCDRRFDRLMHQAVRTLDDEQRWAIERRLVERLQDAVPAVPLYNAKKYVIIRRPGVHGFRWSPIGFYELMGMTRS